MANNISERANLKYIRHITHNIINDCKWTECIFELFNAQKTTKGTCENI